MNNEEKAKSQFPFVVFEWFALLYKDIKKKKWKRRGKKSFYIKDLLSMFLFCIKGTQ